MRIITLGITCGLLFLSLVSATACGQDTELPLVTTAARQPLEAQVKRVVQALDEVLGAPLPAEVKTQLGAAYEMDDGAQASRAIQAALDPLCLAFVHINPESRVKVEAGSAERELVQHGWRTFLVKVHNEGGVTAPMRVLSPNAPVPSGSSNHPAPDVPENPNTRDQWLAIDVVNRQPLNARLSGLSLEYRVVALYSRDEGDREAKLAFDVGQGTQDLGFRNEVNLLFSAAPAVPVTLEVVDENNKPTTAAFEFRDKLGRVYPSRTRRLAPDFFFQDQVYRHHGESVLLPPGEYSVVCRRGPEYTPVTKQITVPEGDSHKESFQLKRWIHLARLGWYSGDHHVHAAGCAHYDQPTQGVAPEDMMRHILGEDLNVGCVLAWGPCWYFQKQYFSGGLHPLSTPDYLMRYDVEVSGFPSSHAGHICLLRLNEDDYPGTTQINEWPSWGLPVLKWGKEQGGVTGFAHSGWGLQVPGNELPNYNVPAFDGIGANEFIVDVTHDACDFISTVDTPAVWELNIWYHTLNCGFTTRISGETDFPCIYGQRVGLGRSYVKLKPDEPLTFDAWTLGIRDGRAYVSDGYSHLPDFQINGLGVGQPGAENRASVLQAKSGDELKIKINAASLLGEEPDEAIRNRSLDQQPYWHVERARVGDSRKVPVELIVNGIAVERREIDADGELRELTFDYRPQQSCWVAVRIFPSAHTNPIFVEVDDKPIRASKRSAQWCLQAVENCWNRKSPAYRREERADAKSAYDRAREVYRRILDEAHDDTRN